MEFLIAVDLEGIHGVVGEANKTLNETPCYQKAIEGATLEINTAVRALFENGATKVAVWDNHGGGGNLDFSRLDERVIKITPVKGAPRYDFVKEHNFSAILFFGYHAKEGTPKGVLAHSYNSRMIQYARLNGIQVGELTIDSLICQSHGITPIFSAGDDISLKELTGIYPDVTTVITKYGKSRNSADLRAREDVLADIYTVVSEAAKKPFPQPVVTFTSPSVVEVRYTRGETTPVMLDRAAATGISAVPGEDTHILYASVTSANQIPILL